MTFPITTAGEEGIWQRIDRLPIRDDLKRELTLDFKNKRRNFEQFEKIFELPWGVFFSHTPDICLARSLVKDTDYWGDKTEKAISEYAVIQATNPTAKFPSLSFIRRSKRVDKEKLSLMTRLLGRPVKTITFNKNTTWRDVVGSNQSMGRVMEAVRKAKCCNPVILCKNVDEIADCKLRSIIKQLIGHKRSQSFVDRSIRVPFDLSNVLFVTVDGSAGLPRQDLWETTEKKIELIKTDVLPLILDRFNLEERAFLFSDDLLRTIIDECISDAGIDKCRGLLMSIAYSLEKFPRFQLLQTPSIALFAREGK